MKLMKISPKEEYKFILSKLIRIGREREKLKRRKNILKQEIKWGSYGEDGTNK